MTNFALEDGVFISTKDELGFEDLPRAFTLVIRGIIHRKAYGKDVEFFVLEYDEQLQELFGDTPIVEFALRPLYKVDGEEPNFITGENLNFEEEATEEEDE